MKPEFTGPAFRADENHQFNGSIISAGQTVHISELMLREEIAKGKHPDAKRNQWISGLLAHSTPANPLAWDLMGEKPKEKENTEEEDRAAKEAEQKAKEAIWAEMDRNGQQYDKRWNLKRLKAHQMKISNPKVD